MAKTLSRPADAALYEEDFYLWVERQAGLLREGRFRDLDLEHLIEEVEDLGINLRNAVTSRTREIILHLLKLQYSPAVEPRGGWEESIGKQRDDLELELTAESQAASRGRSRHHLPESAPAGGRRAGPRPRDAGSAAVDLPLRAGADHRSDLVARERARHQRSALPEAIMLLIPCPWCGEREETEFRCGGEAHILRPRDPAALSDDAVGRLPVHADQPQGRALRALAARPWLRALVQPCPRHGQRPDPRGLPDGRAAAEDRSSDGRDHASRGQAGPDAGRIARRRRAMSHVGPGHRAAHRLPEGGRIDRRRRSASPSTARATRASPATRSPRPCSPTASIWSGAASSTIARAASSRPAPRSPTRWSSSVAAAAPSPTSAPPRSSCTTGWSPHSQNCWPSLEFDLGAVNDLLEPAAPGRLLLQDLHVAAAPGGATSTSARSARAAGLGKAPTRARSRPLRAPLRALRRAGRGRRAGGARGGARGRAQRRAGDPGGASRPRSAARCWPSRRATRARPGSTRRGPSSRPCPRSGCSPRTTAFGYYDHNYLGLVERVTDHLGPAAPPHLPRQRLWKLRARQVVLATGAIERPLVFAENDRPGIMLAGAVRSYLHRQAVLRRPAGGGVHQQRQRLSDRARPARRGRGRGAWSTCAQKLEGALAAPGRSGRDRRLGPAMRSPAPRVACGSARSRSGRSTRRATASRGRPKPSPAIWSRVSGGWNPTIHLHSQSRARPRYDRARGMFLPGAPIQAERSAGACNGTFALAACLEEGARAGVAAARPRASRPTLPELPRFDEPEEAPARLLWQVPSGRPPRKSKCSSTCRTTSPRPTSRSRCARATARSSTSSATPRPAWAPTRARPATSTRSASSPRSPVSRSPSSASRPSARPTRR